MTKSGQANNPTHGYLRRKQRIGGVFISHLLEMRLSIAWKHLPNNARRVLDRLEIEHAEHGGAENGNLRCPYTDFEAAGIRRPSIAIAIRQCVAFGFVEVVDQGGRSISDRRWPSIYRLTYIVGVGSSPVPTNEWRKITTDEEAEAALSLAASQKNYGTQPPQVRRLRAVRVA